MISCRAPGAGAVFAQGAAGSVDLLPHGGCLEAGGIQPPRGRARGLLAPAVAGIGWASVYAG